MITNDELEDRNEGRSPGRRRPTASPPPPSAGDDPGQRPAAPTPPSLRDRLAEAKQLRPAREAHCGCCFGAGRDAAVRLIEGALEG